MSIFRAQRIQYLLERHGIQPTRPAISQGAAFAIALSLINTVTTIALHMHR